MDLPGGGPVFPAADSERSVVTATQALTTRPQVTPPPPLVSQGTDPLEGVARVDLNGEFTYTIPIVVPPGRAGMQPPLALSYSSRRGNGLLGVGWDLTGRSAITRCDKVVASGGVRGRVEFTNSDQLCLDGQRLVLVSGTAGTVGATYRTEVDTFTRVKLTAIGSGMTWTAEYKDGSIATFAQLNFDFTLDGDGTYWTSRRVLKADGSPSGSDTSPDLSWPLVEMRDRSGNSVLWDDLSRIANDAGYVRSNDNPLASADPLPGRIVYNRCKTAPCDYLSDTRRIDFEYEDRVTDHMQRFVNGVEILSTKRLQKIITSVKDGATWVKQLEYRLFYKTSLTTKRSLLWIISVCDGGGSCTPNLVLDWQHEGAYVTRDVEDAGSFAYRGGLAPSSGNRAEIAAFDADGDGNDDLLIDDGAGRALLLGDGAGFYKSHLTDIGLQAPCTSGHMATVTPVDLDGNGRQELVFECGPEYRVLGWSDAQGRLVEQAVPGLHGRAQPPWPVPVGEIATAGEGLLKMMDLDGDGLPELVSGSTSDGGKWSAQRATRATLTPTTLPQVAYGAVRSTMIPSIGPHNQVIGGARHVAEMTATLDQDGDGHHELTAMDFRSAMRSYTWQGTNAVFGYRDDPDNVLWIAASPVGSPPSPPWANPQFTDLNGRGLWYFVDVNGDGLKDGLYRTQSSATPPVVTWSLRINTGAGYRAPVTDLGPGTATLVAYPGDLVSQHLLGVVAKGRDNGLRVADMNGDGREDLILLNPVDSVLGPTHASGFHQTTGRVRVLHANGTGFDAPVSLPAYASEARRLYRASESASVRWPMSVLADLDGNGITDLVEMVGNVTHGRRDLVTQTRNLPGGVDLLTTITDHRGPVHSVVYDSMSRGSEVRLSQPLTGNTHVASFTSAAYPKAAASKGTVVRQHRGRDKERGRQLDDRYSYSGGMIDLTGRGFLGFESVAVRDQTTGSRTDHTFDLSPVVVGVDSNYRHYPKARHPVSTVVLPPIFGNATDLAVATGAVPRPTKTWSALFLGSPLRMDSETDTSHADTPGSGVSKVEVVTSFDTWGNPKSVVTTTTDAVTTSSTAGPRVYTRSLTSSYTNTESTWLLGQLTKVIDTTTANAAADPLQSGATGVTQSSSTSELSYDTAGRLQWVIIEPTPTAVSTATQSMTRMIRTSGGLVTSVIKYLPRGTACTQDSNCDGGTCGRATAAGALQCWATRTDQFIYDGTGSFVEGFTNALDQTRWVLHDPAHAWAYATVDPNGFVTKTTRDGFGRPRLELFHTGRQLTTTYERDIIRRGELNGQSTSTFLDPLGRPMVRTWSTFNGGSAVSGQTYDSLGNVVATTYKGSTSTEAAISDTLETAQDALANPVRLSSATYDAAGRLVSTTKGTSETSSITYLNPLGTVSVTDGMDLSSSTFSDVFGRPLEVRQRSRDGTTSTTTYRYAPTGTLGSIKNPGGIVERFTYDTLGRQLEWTTGSADGTSSVQRQSTGYNGLGEVTFRSTNGSGAVLARDRLGRLILRYVIIGGESQTFEWDPPNGIGQRKRVINSRGGHEILYAFNSLGQLEQQKENFDGGTTSLSFGFTYDTNGRLSTLRYPEATGSTDVSSVSHENAKPGPTVRYNYRNGQLQSLSEVGNGNAVLWEATTRHPMGMVTQARYGAALLLGLPRNPNTLRLEGQGASGITFTGPRPDQQFFYRANGTLERKRTNAINETFGYDGSRRFLDRYDRTPIQGTNGTVSARFSYGAQGITGVDTTVSTQSPDWSQGETPEDETYTFPTTNAHEYRLGTHRIGSRPAQTFVYNTRGQVTEVLEGTTVKRKYSWASFGLPSKVEHFGPDLVRTFTYNAFGERVRKTQDASNEVLYVGKLYEARNLTTLGVRESVYRLFSDEGVIGELAHPWTPNAPRVTRHLFTDQQGSIAYQVVGSTSTQLGFFPFGKRMGTPPAQSFSQLGYTGHHQDDDIGLINMNGRVYDVTTRRFLSRDVIPDQAFTTFGTHPYAYVGNNPTNATDPTGFGTQFNGGSDINATRNLGESLQQRVVRIEEVTICGFCGLPPEDRTPDKRPKGGGAEVPAPEAPAPPPRPLAPPPPATPVPPPAPPPPPPPPREPPRSDPQAPAGLKDGAVNVVQAPSSQPLTPGPVAPSNVFEIWRRPANLGGGTVGDISDWAWNNFRYGHNWLHYPYGGVGAGMGAAPNGGGWGQPTMMDKHNDAHGKDDTELVMSVVVRDPAAVLKRMEPGTGTGNWYPLLNDCHDAAHNALKAGGAEVVADPLSGFEVGFGSP